MAHDWAAYIAPELTKVFAQTTRKDLTDRMI